MEEEHLRNWVSLKVKLKDQEILWKKRLEEGRILNSGAIKYFTRGKGAIKEEEKYLFGERYQRKILKEF